MIRRKYYTAPCCSWIVVVVAAIVQQLLLLIAPTITTTIVHAQSSSSNFVQSVVPCGSNTSISRNFSGYVTIEAMNFDMRNELEQIQNGRPSQEPYIFILCPDIIFDLSIEPLRPQLSGSIFTCGMMGNVSLGCEFRGGTDQIIIDDITTTATTTNNNYTLLSVNFIGITHTSFTNSVYSGTATSSTTIDVTRSSFQNFNAASVVRQVNNNNAGMRPFKVQISDCTIANAVGTDDNTGGNIVFLNLGGELTIENVTIIDSSNLLSFVTTGSSNTTEGTTFLRNIIVMNSDISDIFVAMQAADIDAVDVTITGMTDMATVFDIVGDGSTAVLENIIINNNNLAGTNRLWTGINIRDRAIGMVTNFLFQENSNVRHILSASMSANLNIQRSRVLSASGGRVVNERDISAGVFVNMQSTATLTNIRLDETASFTAIYFAGGGSNMTIRNTCIGEGDNQGTVYISEESNYIAESSYIKSSFVTTVCTEAGLRLIQELPGSGCFDVNRTDCEFNCTSFMEVDSCMAQLVVSAPSMAPINVTQAPAVAKNPTFRPTIGTRTPKSVGMTAVPSQKPVVNMMRPTKIPMRLPSSAPVKLPPIFTVSSFPVTDRFPTAVPSNTPKGSSSAVPSRFPRRSFRPTPKFQPTSLETQLPTSILAPSTSKPSCDCYRGKGKKTKKNRGKGMGMGKRKRVGTREDGNDSEGGGILSYLSFDDDIVSYQKGIDYDDDMTTDTYDSVSLHDDDNCVCRESRKGKGKRKKGKGKQGKGGHGKESLGKGDKNKYQRDSEQHESLSLANYLLHYLGNNDEQR